MVRPETSNLMSFSARADRGRDKRMAKMNFMGLSFSD
jgi:hypothetical protein